MTNDTPLWYMDADFLCYRDRPIDKQFSPFVMVRGWNNERADDLLILSILKYQPRPTGAEVRLLHNHTHTSADNATILRLVLTEHLSNAEANTASLEAQLAQALDGLKRMDAELTQVCKSHADLNKKYRQQTIELEDERSFAKSLYDDRRRLADDNLVLSRKLDAVKELNIRLTAALETSIQSHNTAHDELQAITESLNEKTLALNNMRQFYRDRDAELDRMREYTRQVTQERTILQSTLDETNAAWQRGFEFCTGKDHQTIEGLRAQLRTANEQLDAWQELDRKARTNLEVVMAEHNKRCDERDQARVDYKRLDDAFVKLHQQYTQLATTVQHAERMRVSALELSTYTLDNLEQK